MLYDSNLSQEASIAAAEGQEGAEEEEKEWIGVLGTWVCGGAGWRECFEWCMDGVMILNVYKTHHHPNTHKNNNTKQTGRRVLCVKQTPHTTLVRKLLPAEQGGEEDVDLLVAELKDYFQVQVQYNVYG